MYSKTLEPKVKQMFNEIIKETSVIIDSSSSENEACKRIAEFVASELSTRSKTMLSDMYSFLSKQILDSIPDSVGRNRFRDADLKQEINKKYDFDISKSGIDFNEANHILSSLAAGAGTAAVGGLLIYALSPAAPTLPIAIVVAASVGTFCLSYFKVAPDRSRANFKNAINKYLSEAKESYLAWFDEVERYFNKRAEEIMRSVGGTRNV